MAFERALTHVQIETEPGFVDAVETLTRVLDRGGSALPAEFVDRCAQLFESGERAFSVVNLDRGTASGAVEHCLVFEGAGALLELAATARALEADLGIKHGVSP